MNQEKLKEYQNIEKVIDILTKQRKNSTIL